MYYKHPIFIEPENENVKIWRYLDLAKFVSLIDKQALFFSRADKLPDHFEGSISILNIENRRNTYKGVPESSLIKFGEMFKELRKSMVINSWHMNDCESAAMWELYLKTDEGIAIQSTYKRLKDSFHLYKEDNVNIGKVKYINYSTDYIPEGNTFYPYLHKRKSFEHENELRAIMDKTLTNIDKTGQRHYAHFDRSPEIFESGVYVNVDLDILIENIFVSPISQKWFFDVVKAIKIKYNLKQNIMQSSLVDGPVF